MTTIMTQGNSEGTRRCDATCHDAKEPKCECVCGGRYHGVGSKNAQPMLQDDLLEGRWGDKLKKVAEDVVKLDKPVEVEPEDIVR